MCIHAHTRLHTHTGMLRCMITLYTCCQKAIQDSPADQKVTWAQIKTAFGGPADTPNGIIQKVRCLPKH